MKNFKKIIVSAIAAVMAAGALATTAGAAEYYNNDGSYWYDGTNNGKVYFEDEYGYYRDLDDYKSDYSYDYNYNYNYSSDGCVKKYLGSTENTSYSYSDAKYIGYDVYYGNIYYRADRGYYASNKSGTVSLGQNFTFTEYAGTDQYGRKLYYRSEFGYIYLSGKTWYCLGYSVNYIR